MTASTIQFSSAQGSEVENTTTEGSLARKIFAANELQPGQVYSFVCGVEVVDNNSTDTLVVGVRFGSAAAPASNTACAATAAIDVADADQAVVHGTLVVQSATRAVMTVLASGADAKGTVAVYAHKTVLTIAADTAYNLDVTALWSVAHADNEVAADAFAIWRVV